MHKERLVEAFNMMWHERSSTQNGSISDMIALIRSELRDEFTHPRVRRSPMEKYRFAIDRIEQLPVEDEIKHELTRLYTMELTSITGNVNPN